jgi:calcineurin-like phosphoesterase
LRSLQKMKDIAFTVVNGENANVVGSYTEPDRYHSHAGADAVTMGKPHLGRWELQPYLNEKIRVLRPLNFAQQCPGRGDMIFDTDFGPVRVINLLGAIPWM